MPSPHRKKLSLAVLLVVLAGAAAWVPLREHLRGSAPEATPVAVAPPPAQEPAEPPVDATPPAPPGADTVPAEEAESDRGPASATPAGPTLSFARAAGLHHAPDPLRLNSSVALLVDQDSGEVLVRKNDQAVLPIASLTKLMSSLVVLEANQPMDEVLTITEEDVDTERHSRSRLRVGTRLTRGDALRLALMSSENRAAHALGRAYPGGLEKAVQAMNAKARQLGMKNTTYVDPTGLSNRNQSTARDLALLVGASSRNPLMRDFSTMQSHLADVGGRTLQYVNSNRLVRSKRAGWDIELQKTGYIVEAGRCLTMLTKVGGHNLILVLLDADSNRDRVTDAERMRRWLVAEWNLPEPVMVAEAQPARKAAAKKKPEGKRSTVVAKKDSGKKQKEKAGTKTAAADKGKATTASAKDRKTTRTASAKDGKRDGAKSSRVRQTFAAAPDERKS